MKSIFFTSVAGCGLAIHAGATPPVSREELVAKFPSGFTRRASELREANHHSLPASGASIAAAREFFALAQQHGEERYASLAETALERWTDGAPASPQVLVLLAAVKQHKHEFAAALALLDQALLRDPANREALVLQVSILQTRGEYEQARRVFQRHPDFSQDLAGITLISSISGSNGQLHAGWQLLSLALEAEPAAPNRVLAWSWAALAEMSLRRGDPAAAEREFRRALSFGEADISIQNAFSMFLLDSNRHEEALSFIANRSSPDSFRLCRALALKAKGAAASELAADVERLRAQFAASPIHQREQALFLLKIEGDRSAALNQAVANWAVQKEPIDLRLLLECAIAADQPAAAQPALEFISRNKFEDARLKPLVQKLNAAL